MLFIQSCKSYEAHTSKTFFFLLFTFAPAISGYHYDMPLNSVVSFCRGTCWFGIYKCLNSPILEQKHHVSRFLEAEVKKTEET